MDNVCRDIVLIPDYTCANVCPDGYHRTEVSDECFPKGLVV